MEELLGSEVIRKDGSTVAVSSLAGDGKLLGLYFSAHWCPPCRAFTPALAAYYEAEKAGACADKFEFVFVSFDRDEKSFKEYFDTMPFLAMDHASDKKEALGEKFGVSGIPCLVFLNGDGSLKTKDGRNLISGKKTIQEILAM